MSSQTGKSYVVFRAGGRCLLAESELHPPSPTHDEPTQPVACLPRSPAYRAREEQVDGCRVRQLTPEQGRRAATAAGSPPTGEQKTATFFSDAPCRRRRRRRRRRAPRSPSRRPGGTEALPHPPAPPAAATGGRRTVTKARELDESCVGRRDGARLSSLQLFFLLRQPPLPRRATVPHGGLWNTFPDRWQPDASTLAGSDGSVFE